MRNSRAGKDSDTPADPRSAGLLAQRLLELNVSAIIDLYEPSYEDKVEALLMLGVKCTVRPASAEYPERFRLQLAPPDVAK